jgi:hypothetical protein
MLMVVGIKMLQDVDDANDDAGKYRYYAPESPFREEIDANQLYFVGTGGRGRVGGGPGHGGRLFDAMLDSS